MRIRWAFTCPLKQIPPLTLFGRLRPQLRNSQREEGEKPNPTPLNGLHCTDSRFSFFFLRGKIIYEMFQRRFFSLLTVLLHTWFVLLPLLHLPFFLPITHLYFFRRVFFCVIPFPNFPIGGRKNHQQEIKGRGGRIGRRIGSGGGGGGGGGGDSLSQWSERRGRRAAAAAEEKKIQGEKKSAT